MNTRRTPPPTPVLAGGGLPARPQPRLSLLALAVSVTFGWGCTATHHHERADKEVYGILHEKQKVALGKTNEFTVDTEFSKRRPDQVTTNELKLSRLATNTVTLALPDSLSLAISNSRNFQLRKETLYLSALGLSRDRYEYRPKFFGGATARRAREASGEQTGSLGTRAGVSQALTSGGRIGLGIANDLFRFYTGDPRRSAVSTISLDLAQPLLRGTGRRVAAESLTQSERNVVYEVRTFSRFQHTFAIDIISTYYRLVQQKDVVRNEFKNYESLVQARERAEALAKDRFSGIQVDQARQDELSARNRYLIAIQGYEAQLDQFKLTLGLPLGVRLSLDDSALEELTRLGLIGQSFEEEDAYQLAVENRLDLLNAIDRFEDAKRKIVVARDQLRPDLNIVADASARSDGSTDYTRFNMDRVAASAGLELNLPFDRLRERNGYRASLIAFERELRALTLALDGVRDDVRRGLRNLRQARQSYAIQRRAVELAERRVESADILVRAGRAQIRDFLEAQNSLVQARNAVTQTLVDYHIARLRFLVDLGKLETGEDRFWARSPDGTEASQAVELESTGTPVPKPEELFKR